MEEALSQLLYRLMRDDGLTAYGLSLHIRQCDAEPAKFSDAELGELARSLAADLAKAAEAQPA